MKRRRALRRRYGHAGTIEARDQNGLRFDVTPIAGGRLRDKHGNVYRRYKAADDAREIGYIGVEVGSTDVIGVPRRAK